MRISYGRDDLCADANPCRVYAFCHFSTLHVRENPILSEVHLPLFTRKLF
jgi:hypothetical protein